jgi:hypothetical protein
MSSDSMMPFPDPRDVSNYFARQTSHSESPECQLDHWLDDALRAVPLPAGFLERVQMMARSADTAALDGCRGPVRWQSIDRWIELR